MIDITLQPYWLAAYKARRGPDKSYWRAFIALQGDYEPNTKFRTLYINLKKELDNDGYNDGNKGVHPDPT